MRVSGLELCVQPGDLPLGETLGPDLQGVADPVERIPRPIPVIEGALLYPATDLIDDGQAEFHDVEGINLNRPRFDAAAV